MEQGQTNLAALYINLNEQTFECGLSTLNYVNDYTEGSAIPMVSKRGVFFATCSGMAKNITHYLKQHLIKKSMFDVLKNTPEYIIIWV